MVFLLSLLDDVLKALSCALQPIIWVPMALQVLYSLSAKTISADFSYVLQMRCSQERCLMENLARERGPGSSRTDCYAKR